jgi:hypothetical protein
MRMHRTQGILLKHVSFPKPQVPKTGTHDDKLASITESQPDSAAFALLLHIAG